MDGYVMGHYEVVDGYNVKIGIERISFTAPSDGLRGLWRFGLAIDEIGWFDHGHEYTPAFWDDLESKVQDGT